MEFEKSEDEQIKDLLSKNKSFEIKCSYTDLVDGSDLKNFANITVDEILAGNYKSCVLVIDSTDVTTKVYFNIQNNYEHKTFANIKGKTFVSDKIDASSQGDYQPVFNGVVTLTVSTAPTESIIYKTVNIEIA